MSQDLTESKKTRFISPALSSLSRLRPPLNAGELKVLEFFDKNLDIEWEIYIQPPLNGLRPDFVLLHPNRGIAVFEVKDWDPQKIDYQYNKSFYEFNNKKKKINTTLTYLSKRRFLCFC